MVLLSEMFRTRRCVESERRAGREPRRRSVSLTPCDRTTAAGKNPGYMTAEPAHNQPSTPATDWRAATTTSR